MVDDTDLQFGSAVHDLLVQYFTKLPSEEPDEEQIKRLVELTFSDYPLKIMKRKLERQKKVFLDFEIKRRRRWRVYKPTFVEMRLEGKLFSDLPGFVGVIDFYSKEERTVIDWKTSGESMSDDNMIQGKIYEMLLRANGYPVDKVYFVSLETGQMLQTPRITDGWIYKVASSIIENIKHNRFPPKPAGHCSFCEYVLDCSFHDKCFWLGV